MSKWVLTLLLLSLSIQAQATDCEKWKSEIAAVTVQATSYALAYSDYHDNKISKDDFFTKTHKMVEKIKLIQDRTEKVSSCLDEVSAYEQRRIFLHDTLAVALPVMAAGEYLGPYVIDALKNYLTTSQEQASQQQGALSSMSPTARP